MLSDEEFDQIQDYYERLEPQVEAGWPTFDAMDNGDRAFVVLWACNGQISNGGVYDLFQNPSGDIAPLLPAAASRLGLERHVPLAEAILSVLDEGFPRDFDERYAAWERLRETVPDEVVASRIDPLEKEWYEREGELEQALLRHVRRAGSPGRGCH